MTNISNRKYQFNNEHVNTVVNKKVDVVTNYFKQCAQRSFVNSFNKKSSEKERKYRDAIVEAGFKILRIENQHIKYII